MFGREEPIKKNEAGRENSIIGFSKAIDWVTFDPLAMHAPLRRLTTTKFIRQMSQGKNCVIGATKPP